jgi:uncharacterized protein (DUF1499 family)
MERKVTLGAKLLEFQNAHHSLNDYRRLRPTSAGRRKDCLGIGRGLTWPCADSPRNVESQQETSRLAELHHLLR